MLRAVVKAPLLLLLFLLGWSSTSQAAEFQLTQGDKLWLANHQYTFTFTGDPNWLPFEAFEGEEYIGIVAAFLDKFAQETGITIQYRPTDSWSETLKFASSKQVDVISDVLGSLTIQDNYTFTTPYLSNSLVVISDQVGGQIHDLNELNGHTLGIIKGYGYTWELYRRHPESRFLEVDNIQEAFTALEQGEVDYLVTSYALGQFQIAALHKHHLHIRGQLPIETHLAFAVRSDWPQLIDLFNRWIDSLTPEQRYQIAENWYLGNSTYFHEEQTDWRYMVGLGGVILFLSLLTGIIWYNRQRIQQEKQQFSAALGAIDAVQWRMPKQTTEFELPDEFQDILPYQMPHPTTLSGFIDLISPADQEAVYDAFRQARLDSERFIDVEFRLNTPKACWFAIKGRSNRAFNKQQALIGTLENITSRKLAELEKERSNAIVSILFDVLPDLVALDLFDNKTIANRAYRSFFKDKSLFESLSEEQKAIWQRQENAMLETHNLCHTSTWVTPDDERQAYLSIIRTPFMNSDQQVTGILSVARDITDNFVLQQELQDAKHRADQANASKSVFLANMSHEIRTPLNAILGYAQLLQQDELPTESQRQIQRIYSAGHRLLGLINDILDLSKIEAGRLQINEEKFPLLRELQDLAALHSQKAQAKGLDFISDIQIDHHDYVQTDRVKIGQIIINALDNAVKFTETGSIKFEVTYRQKRLKIRITDTGPGINQEELDRLFLPFSQGQSGQVHGGTGLGLVLARRLAHALNGSFSLHSSCGQGTEAQIDLPLTLLTQDTEDEQSTHWQLAKTHSKTALLIEDDELSRDMLQSMLKKIGFRVLLAEDGEQALDYLSYAIDIVFTDIRMPNMDGMALLQHIKQQAEHQNLPVIAVSASSFEHERKFYLESGFSDFIPKPVAWSQLCQSIRRYIELTPSTLPIPTLPDTPSSSQRSAEYIDDAAQSGLIEQLKQACQLGDADEAMTCVNKLQDSNYATDKLDIIKSCIERYDFDKALSLLL